MKKNFFAILLCLFIIIPIIHIPASAERSIVYTSFTRTSAPKGDGTAASPYNLFKDAIDAVADGGIIYISNGSGFINIDNDFDSNPYIIEKNVTVAPAPGSQSASLNVRKSGMVLDADIMFQNIELCFANKCHAAIFANGHTLTLENSYSSKSTRMIHIFAGGLYSKNGYSLSPASGEHSVINITGNAAFGNIYGGSMNGSSNTPANININGVSSSQLGNIYACGASEGLYNPDNILDYTEEPTAPAPDPIAYPALSQAFVNLNDSHIMNIDGNSGGEKNMSVECSSTYVYECNLKNINSITVNRGTLSPKEINEDVNIIVMENGDFNISLIENCYINNFTSSGGTLTMGYDNYLTINGAFSGSAEFRISGARDTSWIAKYDCLYVNVKNSDNGVFTFTPHPNQKHMTFNKTADGWKTSEWVSSGTPLLTKFELCENAIAIKKSTINGKDGNVIPTIKVNSEFTDPSDPDNSEVFWDIGLIPMIYSVTHNGKTIGPVQSEEDPDGYQEGNFSPLHMYIQPIDNEILVCNLSWIHISDNPPEIETGIYDISITAPIGESDSVTQNFRLTVLNDDGTPPLPKLTSPQPITYGTPLSAVDLGGWNWESPDTIAEVKNNGYTAYCDIDDVNCDYSQTDGYNSEKHRVERDIAVTVNKANANIRLAEPHMQSDGNGGALALSAAVSGVEHTAVPTGTITFYLDDNLLANAPINDNTAQFLYDSPREGEYSLTAHYSGDDNYASCSSVALCTLTALNVSENGGITITFDNLSGKNLDNASLIAAAYKNGVLTGIHSERFSALKCARKTFQADMAAFEYDKLHVFIWNRTDALIPVCKNY